MCVTWVGISSKVGIWVEVGSVICHDVLQLSSLCQQIICVSSRKGPEVMHVGALERRVACCVLYSSSQPICTTTHLHIAPQVCTCTTTHLCLQSATLSVCTLHDDAAAVFPFIFLFFSFLGDALQF